ncbi:chromosome segregation protein SMC [Geothrix sp. 21YS21S-2]|uniref:chromosome segregation protein SMC n=1 Tax=Geothrix sp. 21YS21S-2 TaxID=3068893 RepID=UPI0027BA0125|nr:chromosome segregation protein SMC [Geothrix sp. 21YS21S-2]
MRLIALEVNGFKSFADPQKLSFPVGMTAVVGPNGCGKSNISDALAWVLGEQRATLLRGAEMADVIFAGTGQRKPMGMAEVKLTLEMPDPGHPGSVREVVISRRLYRDTGSEYRINGRECRLKDVSDLLMDTGMGTRAYSFIQQGQIDLILSSKPKDRRSLLEEAAGITRYKLRRTDAERRLEETRANLLRLDDILFELNKQQESLKRQAAKARRAQELDVAIKATQRILLAGKASELEEAKERILENLDALERRIAALTAQASEKSSEVEGLRLALDEMNHRQDKRARAVMGLDQRLGLLDQDRGFQGERIQDSEQTAALLQARLDELSARSGDTEAETARLQEALKAAETALEARDTLVADAEEAVALAGGALRHIEGELKELRARRVEAEREALAAQRRRQAVHQEIAQRSGRLDSLNHEEAIRAPRLETLEAESLRLGREEEGAAGRLEQMEEAVQVQSRIRQETAEAHRAAAAALREAEGALEAQELRMRQLGDLLRDAAGSDEQRKALEWLRGRGVLPTAFVDAVSVDDEHLPDLERLLGAWIQTVDLGEARGAWEAPGQLIFSAGGPADPVPAPEGAWALRDAVKWRPGRPRPLEGLLNRAFACEDAALTELAKAHPDLAFVSPALVKLPFGPVQGGVAAPAASPLKLRHEFEAAKAAREEGLDRVEALESAVKTADYRMREAADRFKEMDEDHMSARRVLEDLKGRRASASAQLREIKEAQERADAQWEQLEAEIATLQAQLRDLEAPAENPEEAELVEAVHAAEARRAEAQKALDDRRETLVEASRMRGSAWSERDAVQRHLQQLQRGVYDLEAEKGRVQADIAASSEKAAQAAARLEELELETNRLLVERQELVEEQNAALPGIESAQEFVRVQERNARELGQALENARQLHQESLLQGAQVQGSMEAMSREIELALGFTVPDFLASISDEEKEAWAMGELVHQTRMQELQSKRLDLGGVNPLAIQELQEAEDRLAFMNEQRRDVTEAIGNLEATIREINATSEERFREAFEFINTRFHEVFREAFGGGAATLILQDPKDLLECGIEITAQPPGKSAKALTLLSGGEKALTAISLLFAIFHYKPSPFCVLDEVDAPLDEANVGRFAAMVQRMKEGTQFIVITHQKPTMIAADTLYGVTMEEMGVSRLVSVQLREAAQLV